MQCFSNNALVIIADTTKVVQGCLGCIIPTADDKFRTVDGEPTITIHVPGPLRTYCAGKAQLSISANTVRAALEDLERSQSTLYRNVCDETGTVRRHLNVFVNYGGFALDRPEVKDLASLFWQQIEWIHPESYIADGNYLNFVSANKTLFATVRDAVKALS